MQSGFGVKFLFWSGEFEENCRRISQRILMANFDSDFLGLVFQGFRPPKKIHAQNSRPELSAFLSNFTFSKPKIYSRRFSAYGGDQNLVGALGVFFWRHRHASMPLKSASAKIMSAVIQHLSAPKTKSREPLLQLVPDKFDHAKGQKSAISGRRLHWRLSTGFFAFSPAFMCNLVRRAP